MKKFRHVILIGVDGGGHFFREAETPNFDRIFADGAVTYEAYASNPSISAECWTSMLTGVSPKLHGCTNDVLSSQKYPLDSPFPTLFKRIRQARPEAELGAFCDWYPLINGACERNVGVCCCSEHDALLVPKAARYIIRNKPDFLFLHCDSVDHAGHHDGYGTPNHLAQIGIVDGYVGQIYEAVQQAGIAEDTLFLMICDHGGTCDPRQDGTGFQGSHGGWTENEKLITFAAAGHGIKKGEIGDMNIRDVAAIVLYAMGIEHPDFKLDGWTSQLPQGLFEEAVPPYIDISAETGAEPRISRAQHATELL